jgi:hypothetical protein
MVRTDKIPGVQLVTDRGPAPEVRADYAVQNEGSIVLLWPITTLAVEWVEEHLPEDRQTWGNAVVIDARYAYDIIEGLGADGLVGRAA